MAADPPTKALVLALTDDVEAAVYSVNRLKPEALCFVLPESGKAIVESVQPRIEHMPKRWDWVITNEVHDFATCYRTVARSLPDLLRAWDLQSSDIVVDLTGATAAMAAALSLVTLPWSSRLVSLVPISAGYDGETVDVNGTARAWTQSNPWDEAATVSRRDGCDLFNRGLFAAAAKLFHDVELRVSGGQKPLYRALADLSEGYQCWERFQYRQAWDKLKTGVKALEMASLWGGPPGLQSVLTPIKANGQFLERLVLDPADVKEAMAVDLLAHASRRLHAAHDPEAATRALLRALEAFAQSRLFKTHGIRSWDVTPEQLPQALQDTCRTCYLDDVDGKYKLPMAAQFRALAAGADQLGQAFMKEWPIMKPLLDAANTAVLGHGFVPVKSERVQQLYDLVLKLTGVAESSLPRFPVLTL